MVYFSMVNVVKIFIQSSNYQSLLGDNDKQKTISKKMVFQSKCICLEGTLYANKTEQLVSNTAYFRISKGFKNVNRIIGLKYLPIKIFEHTHNRKAKLILSLLAYPLLLSNNYCLSPG